MKHLDADKRKSEIQSEFSEKIGRFTSSSAYLDLCEEVYGYRNFMFNMMDKEQIDYILNSVPISSDDALLDFGCGNGGLLRLLTEKYQCSATGIDLLDRSLVTCGKGMNYICGDIDFLSDYKLKPTVTLSVDSLYFCSDIDRLIDYLVRSGGNRLYLFYSQYLFDEEPDRSLLKSENTVLAKALQKAGVSFKTIDFSENERLMYLAMEKALCKYRNAFKLENNLDLYEQKLSETLYGTKLYEKGLASRYLYIIGTI